MHYHSNAPAGAADGVEAAHKIHGAVRGDGERAPAQLVGRDDAAVKVGGQGFRREIEGVEGLVCDARPDAVKPGALLLAAGDGESRAAELLRVKTVGAHLRRGNSGEKALATGWTACACMGQRLVGTPRVCATRAIQHPLPQQCVE